MGRRSPSAPEVLREADLSRADREAEQKRDEGAAPGQGAGKLPADSGPRALGQPRKLHVLCPVRSGYPRARGRSGRASSGSAQACPGAASGKLPLERRGGAS